MADPEQLIALAFWGSLVALGYTYVGYPLVLSLVRTRATPQPASPPTLPRVSVVVAAYNEEGCIAEKIRNTLDQDYPADLLECVVVSDGSTDRTDAVAREGGDPRVKVVVQPSRQGKAAALNRGVAEATGSVLVFTDANAMLEPSAISRLVSHFSDPLTGLVSGRGLILERRNGDVHAVTNAYLDYETFIRQRESRLGYIAWADGALYALRRSLFEPLAPVHANDFLHPIQARLRGYRAVMEPAACFSEQAGDSSRGEFQRQARITGQGVYILSTEGPRLVVSREWMVLWQLLSHRVLRWMGALFLAGAFFSGLWLAPRDPVVRVLFGLQVGLYGMALLGGLAEARGWRLRRLSVPYYFCLVNLAGLVGIWRFAVGGVQAVWRPVR